MFGEKTAEHMLLPGCYSFSFKDRSHLKVLICGGWHQVALGYHSVVRGAALLSAPVEDKLSPDLAFCIFLVDLYGRICFLLGFHLQLIVWLKKSGLYCKNSVVPGGQYPGSPYLFQILLFFSLPVKAAYIVLTYVSC